MIARPLTRLSQADVPFICDEECENTFQKLKTLLTEAPVLAYPDESLDTIMEIHTDGSGHGIGAVLYQTPKEGV
jgi:hypothetical protein